MVKKGISNINVYVYTYIYIYVCVCFSPFGVSTGFAQTFGGCSQKCHKTLETLGDDTLDKAYEDPVAMRISPKNWRFRQKMVKKTR